MIFRRLAQALVAACLVGLAILIGSLVWQGASRLDSGFFVTFPSRFAEKAGIFSAWVGTLWIMVLTALIAIPLGVGAGLYLEEYAPRNAFTAVIEMCIANLAAVPSILFGLMALGIFVYALGLGQSLITGALTLSLLAMPIIIVATRESLRAIPVSIREAAYGLGASRWQVCRDHLLPTSLGGIMTGVILGLSRAIGETAPLITIGALTFVAFVPDLSKGFGVIREPFTVLPIQMFNWVSRPQEEFHENAAAAGLVILVVSLTLNGVAMWVRLRVRKRLQGGVLS